MIRNSFALVLTLLLSAVAVANPIKILFIGNSFTFVPGGTTNPALPNHFKDIALALNTEVEIDFVVKPGQTLKKHYDEGEVAMKLSSKKYDYVVLQSQSLEALELPRCFHEKGGPVGRPEFLEYSKKLLDLIALNGAKPVIFAHWTYKQDHPFFKDDFVCLKFESNEFNAGKNWYGINLLEYQLMLNEGYSLAAIHSPNAIKSLVGTKWQALMTKIPDSTLYHPDSYHPSAQGSFFSAMVLAKDILNLNVHLLTEHPWEITAHQFEQMKTVLTD
ncbi:SGNH/GDSL hydrolase family protein [Bdellovibrio reynosensis]|uniref:SGNH/GDSL hydrolase family protein n=1 Tax=Bdellovibrio reynosensis TaxID=2835041 RepID=A0ABY4CEH7_9BACT|nr:hypothetical protein [Bdellovibrio reynosensis]UOF02171.1 hypothetical protein MNR06_04285 [Bdellovibrio reynosensis]